MHKDSYDEKMKLWHLTLNYFIIIIIIKAYSQKYSFTLIDVYHPYKSYLALRSTQHAINFFKSKKWSYLYPESFACSIIYCCNGDILFLLSPDLPPINLPSDFSGCRPLPVFDGVLCIDDGKVDWSRLSRDLFLLALFFHFFT